MQQQKPEPLTHHAKYQKVQRGSLGRLWGARSAGRGRCAPQRHARGAGQLAGWLPRVPATRPLPLACPLQVKDLNSGTFGFVQLALDRTTGRNVAIKFIERGDKVRSPI